MKNDVIDNLIGLFETVFDELNRALNNLEYEYGTGEPKTETKTKEVS